MKYVCSLCYLRKIRVKFKNCCGKAINERMKNAKISALQVIYYIFGNVCLYVCMFVRMFAIGARTVGATELKFGMELGLYPEKVLAKVRAGRTPPPGRGRSKSASGGPCSPNHAFLGKLYKTKVEEHP